MHLKTEASGATAVQPIYSTDRLKKQTQKYLKSKPKVVEWKPKKSVVFSVFIVPLLLGTCDILFIQSDVHIKFFRVDVKSTHWDKSLRWLLE